jgi:hypothetical protein
MPSFTRKATPNTDSTTPTFTGTLPVVNQRFRKANPSSSSEGSISTRRVARARAAACAAP